jgi:hypothetical protein
MNAFRLQTMLRVARPSVRGAGTILLDVNEMRLAGKVVGIARDSILNVLSNWRLTGASESILESRQ